MLKNFLQSSGYTERTILERLDLKSLHELPAGKRPGFSGEIRDPVDLLIRVYLLGDAVARSTIRSQLPADVLAGLEDLGLLISSKAHPREYHSPVVLYPVNGVYVVSDRWNMPDGSPFKAPDDVVYPAITKNTKVFLDMLPSEKCELLLDLCAGTGVAALGAVSQGIARKAWATDIAGRSVRFAEFSRMLNGLSDVEILTSDVYESVNDLSFDRIVAHPPYVPALAPKWVFRDAGEEGEEITRRIVAGLPEHLRPGGRLYCLALGADKQGDPFEKRLRGWLGENHSEFDILLVELETYVPERIASLPMLAGQRTYREYRKWRTHFEETGVKEFFYGYIVIQRHSAARPAFALRRTAGPGTKSPEVEWMLAWETASTGPKFTQTLLDSKPTPSERFELTISHRFEEGELRACGFGMTTEYPFHMECKIQPWTAQVIANCDGTMTGRDLYEYCRREGLIIGEVTAQEFAGLIRSLAAGGFIEIEGFTLPAAGE